jgi:ADP-heptose:LPS heptosyltransferase
LRRAWPDAHLTFVAAPLCEELLRDHPDVDTLLVFRKEEMWLPWRLLAFLRRLRQPRPDLAVVMTTVSFSTTSALLAWASGARVRVGASSLPFGWHLSRAVYNLELPLAPEGPPEVEHNLAPLRALGIVAPLEHPHLAARQDAVQRARDTLGARFRPARAGLEDAREPLVVAHPGAGKRPNCWPAEGFAAVLRALQESRGARVILVEGPRDAEPVAAVAARLDAALRWQAPLGDTLGLLALADLVLCNDTGMAHVAAALGAPTLVLFGPTDPERWKPPGDHVHILRSPTGNLADLDAGTVLQECLRMLDAARAGANLPRAGAHHPA